METDESPMVANNITIYLFFSTAREMFQASEPPFVPPLFSINSKKSIAPSLSLEEIIGDADAQTRCNYSP